MDVNCKSNRDGSYRLTSFTTDHNHKVSEDYYKRENLQLTGHDKELIKDLKTANAKPSQIARVLKEKNKTILSTKQVRNIIQRLIPQQDKSKQEKLADFLENVDKNGGIIETKTDPPEDHQNC